MILSRRDWLPVDWPLAGRTGGRSREGSGVRRIVRRWAGGGTRDREARGGLSFGRIWRGMPGFGVAPHALTGSAFWTIPLHQFASA